MLSQLVPSGPAGRRRRALSAIVATVAVIFGAFGLVASQGEPADAARNCRATKSCPTTTTTAPATTTTLAPTTTTSAPTTTIASATTTTVPPTTTTITAPPGTCVPVSPSSNIQALIDAYGPGTSFCFAPGTYVLTTFLIPRANDKFISTTPRAAILTGNGANNAGIRSGQPWPQTPVSGVTVEGFVIRNMANVWTSIPRAALTTGPNWIVRNNEIAFNTQAGVEMEGPNQLLNNYIHDNGRYGFEGYAVDGSVIDGNEVARNNSAQYDPNDDAGGSKLARSKNVTINNNNVHDNYGQGLWCDADCIFITYSNNTVRNNAGIGIFHEISADAVIRNNTLSGNDSRMVGKSLWWGADIFLNTSKNVEIYGNTVTAGVHGIGMAAYDRGSGLYGRYEVSNVRVHDNVITLPLNGQVGLNSSATLYNPYTLGNTWVHNTYHVPNTSAALFQWSGGGKTWSQWQALGNDTTGSFGN